MTYSDSRGRYSDAESVSLVAAQTVTATGQGVARHLGDEGTVRLLRDVTAISGAGATITVTVETSYDGATGWRTLGAFPARTTVGSDRQSFTGVDRYIRAIWTVAGTTPSVTFSVTGEAV